MELRTIGHAGMLLLDDAGNPLLLTDPWLIGSTYWRSWWLQHYPDPELFERLKQTRYVYVTHTHPDHFHPPTLRKLGRQPKFFCPDLPDEKIAAYLGEQGFEAEPLTPKVWHRLTEDVQVLSLPLWNDDSVLLVDTPKAFILNFNDAKPLSKNVRRLRKFMDENLPDDRPRILLSSYSPASIVNSFLRDSERISIKSKDEYAHYIDGLCKSLNVDYFMPFASQVIFLRSDSQWANAFKVHIEDLKKYWTAKTKLLFPYSTIDLDSGQVSHVEPANYNGNPAGRDRKIREQEELDASAVITDKDIANLEKKMRSHRIPFALLFPRGIGFEVQGLQLVYRSWKGRVEKGTAGGNFTLKIPTQAMKEALAYDHFGDLGITMFTMINLNTKLQPWLVYVFFILITLHDYEHTASVKQFFRWMKSVLATRAWTLPAPPARAQSREAAA